MQGARPLLLLALSLVPPAATAAPTSPLTRIAEELSETARDRVAAWIAREAIAAIDTPQAGGEWRMILDDVPHSTGAYAEGTTTRTYMGGGMYIVDSNFLVRSGLSPISGRMFHFSTVEVWTQDHVCEFLVTENSIASDGTRPKSYAQPVCQTLRWVDASTFTLGDEGGVLRYRRP